MKIIFIFWRVSFFIMFMSLCLTGTAQRYKRDVVYLKNGSVIRGTILEMIPNETIKIETSDGSIFVYKLDEVERTSKGEGIKKSVSNDSVFTKQKFDPKGYFIIARIGPSIRSGKSSGPELTVGFINGIQFNERLSLGLGIEVTDYSYNNHKSSATIMPIFLDMRVYFPTQRVRPMICLQAGYSKVSNTSEQIDSAYFNPGFGNGGLFMAFGIGVRVFINQRISMITDGGVSFQNLQGYSIVNNGSTLTFPSQNISSVRINVGLALSFGKSKKS
jgi:hypothetical protein